MLRIFRPWHSVESRTLALLVLILALTIAVSTGSLALFVWPEFQAVEMQLAQDNARRAAKTVLRDVEQLEALTRDWAEWDDTLAFIAGHNEAFVASNLVPSTLSGLAINSMAYYDAHDRLVWGMELDDSGDALDPLAENARTFFARMLPLSAPFRSGIVRTADGPAIVAAVGITNSNQTAPRSGALMMLRRIDDSYADRLREQLGLAVELTTDAQPALPPHALDRKLLHVSETLLDLDGNPYLTIELAEPRVILERAKFSVWINLATTITGLMLVFAVMWTAVERLILQPLVQLAHDIVPLGRQDSVGRKLDDSRDDEIGRIAYEVNRMQDRIVKLADHDELTGLPLRRLFNDRLASALARAKRADGRFGLIYLDLDGFKGVNDRHGHPVGDELLCAVAERLQDQRRESDTVARLGGDEFAVIVEGISDHAQVEAIRDKVTAAICRPFALSAGAVTIGASAGASVYPDDGTDAEALIRSSDQHMYRVKREHQTANGHPA